MTEVAARLDDMQVQRTEDYQSQQVANIARTFFYRFQVWQPRSIESRVLTRERRFLTPEFTRLESTIRFISPSMTQ